LRIIFSLSVSLLFLLAPIISAFADDVDLPNGSGPLPDLSRGAKSGALVSTQHIHLYRSLLPREVAQLSERGEFAFEAVRNPKQPGKFFIAPGPTKSTLTGKGLNGGVIVDPGGGKAMLSPLFEPPQSVGPDDQATAFKILWNAASLTWRHAYLSASLSTLMFNSVESGAQPNKLEFLVERIHPRLLGGDGIGTLEPIFRERILARKPAALSKLGWLTLRYFGSLEDFVWGSSPVINQTRQLTGSNRSDQIFSGIFAPDDLFVWSGKVELVEPSGLKLVPLLVPIFEVKGDPVVRDSGVDGCIGRVFSNRGAIDLNYQNERFKGAGPWVPANTVMALRWVWRIDLAGRDPFSLDARQTLYIDRDTGLPVYRVVWDHGGRLRKVVIGIVRALDIDDQRAEPFLGGEVIIHGSGAGRLVLLVDRLNQCMRYPGSSVSIDDFDPGQFNSLTPKGP
jgi:hypothetical protein